MPPSRSWRWAVACLLALLPLRFAAAADDGTHTDAPSAAPPNDKAAQPPQGSLGLSPQLPRGGDGYQIARPESGVAVATPSDDWRISFRGYLRAPMRLGFGTRPNPEPGQSETQLHSSPFIPDGNYTDWRFTNNLPNPWTEVHLSYGNSHVKGTVSVESYNLTEAGYRDVVAQLGISRAFLTFSVPEVLGSRVHVEWNVGAFNNRYGAAGQYDAGKYDTYLFGRTRVAGETLSALIPLTDDWTMQIEHGLGAKLERPPAPGVDPNLQYDVGSTVLHHAHAGVTFRRLLQANVHYLRAWTQDLRGSGTNPDASMTITGGELRLNGGAFGYGYVGYSLIRAEHIRPLADAVEVLHSFGGQQFMGNYLGLGGEGTGAVQTVLFQYSLSVASILRHPEPFWGQGPDVVLTAFGMFNSVTSRDPAADGTRKLKWGAEAVYTALAWLGAGLRYDLVSPDMDDGNVAFSVLSPKLLLRSEFITHEQVVIQYSRYFYRRDVVAAWPNAGATPDDGVLMIMATLWW